MDYSPWGCKDLDMTEQLLLYSLYQFFHVVLPFSFVSRNFFFLRNLNFFFNFV